MGSERQGQSAEGKESDFENACAQSGQHIEFKAYLYRSDQRTVRNVAGCLRLGGISYRGVLDGDGGPQNHRKAHFVAPEAPVRERGYHGFRELILFRCGREARAGDESFPRLRNAAFLRVFPEVRARVVRPIRFGPPGRGEARGGEEFGSVHGEAHPVPVSSCAHCACGAEHRAADVPKSRLLAEEHVY